MNAPCPILCISNIAADFELTLNGHLDVLEGILLERGYIFLSDSDKFTYSPAPQAVVKQSTQSVDEMKSMSPSPSPSREGETEEYTRKYTKKEEIFILALLQKYSTESVSELYARFVQEYPSWKGKLKWSPYYMKFYQKYYREVKK